MSRIVAARSKSSNDPDQNINEVETPKMRDPAAFIDFLRSTRAGLLKEAGKDCCPLPRGSLGALERVP
jgi:hypothetical protein